MTVEWAEIPYPVLRRISERIIAEVPHVNRVVYDITSTPPPGHDRESVEKVRYNFFLK